MPFPGPWDRPPSDDLPQARAREEARVERMVSELLHAGPEIVDSMNSMRDEYAARHQRKLAAQRHTSEILRSHRPTPEIPE